MQFTCIVYISLGLTRTIEIAAKVVLEKKKNTRNVSKGTGVAETVSYKTQKGPNLSVQGLRRGSGKACRCLGVQRVICSSADLPL